MPVRVGTSGWSYDDWEGHVYPRAVDAAARLAFYAERFPTVEVDSTYYRDPAPAVVKGWIAKTKDARAFELSVKASGALTHELMVDGTPEQVRRSAVLWRALVADPLAQAGRLGAILMQLSPGVTRHAAARERLAAALEAFAPHQVAVEFRNRTWHTGSLEPELHDDTLALLDEHAACAVVVDGPPFPPIVGGSAPHAYVRFHGRNAERWHKKDEYYGQRYDYEYARDELDPWARTLAKLAKEKELVRVYFNNHVQGKAFRNGLEMQQLLEREAAPVERVEPAQRRLF